jgi:hypothetical protein
MILGKLRVPASESSPACPAGHGTAAHTAAIMSVVALALKEALNSSEESKQVKSRNRYIFSEFSQGISKLEKTYFSEMGDSCALRNGRDRAPNPTNMALDTLSGANMCPGVD